MAILTYCPNCNIYRSRKNTAIIKRKKRAVCTACGYNLDKSKKFRVNVPTPQGKRITEVVEGTLSYARKVESKFKTDVSKEKHFNLHKSPIFCEIFSLYLKWAKENKKDWRHDEGRWELHIKPVLGNRKMNQITTMDVNNLIDGIQKYKVRFVKKGVAKSNHKVKPVHGAPSPATKKQVLVLVKRIFNWAINRELFHGANPASKVEAPKVNNQITECLSVDDLQRLLVTLDNWDNKLGALVVKFAIYTGFRLDEIIGLRWKNVDFERGFVELTDPKGKPVTLPVCNEAIGVLRAAEKFQPITNCQWVFPNNKGQRRVSFGKIWSRIREASKIPKNFRFHGLRHNFASHLVSSGEVDLYTLQKLLNHQDPKMTQRYAHLLDEALRRGANVADKVFVNKKPAESKSELS